MQYIVVDLEATCWKEGQRPERMEIIEIRAVRLAEAAGPVVDEFGEFVRPVAEPLLSEFYTRLTTIRQEDVDAADPFPAVFARFLDWMGSEPYRLCSWDAYDLRQFSVDCARHGLLVPDGFASHINLKKAFSELRGIRPTGMKGALAQLGLPLVGTHHRGIDDVRNITAPACWILPRRAAPATP